MTNFRTYGSTPYGIAVIHGGPGGLGQVAPVGRRLSEIAGVLEPLQTATSLKGQIQELHDVIQANATEPVTLIGHSWGAMLSVLFTAEHPTLVKKLILVSCGPLDPKYKANHVMQNRLDRMTESEKVELELTIKKLDDPATQDKDAVFAKLAEMATKTDSYDLIPNINELVTAQYSMFLSIWPEVEALRSRGGFVGAVKKIHCPVLVIHGDHDPHPAEGVKKVFEENQKQFEFVLLKNCGHYPWMERQAHEKFYEVLKKEIR